MGLRTIAPCLCAVLFVISIFVPTRIAAGMCPGALLLATMGWLCLWSAENSLDRAWELAAKMHDLLNEGMAGPPSLEDDGDE